MNFLTKCILLLGTCFLAISINAETVYVKDELYVPLRSGPSSQHRILHKGLKTSTALELLGKNEDESWINVKTSGGLEGWIPSQYIISTPTSERLLTKAKQDLANLNKTYSAAKGKLEEVSAELDKTKAKLRSTESAQQKSTMELHRIRSISSGAIELDIKYQKLLEDHELLQTENDTLNAENESLKSDQRFSFMFYGAALVLIGMFMSVIIPRLKPKKRHSEWKN